MPKNKRRARPGTAKPSVSANVMPNNIKALRIAKGFTNQTLLAEAVGVTSATVCYWEIGQYCPTPQMMKRLAQVLDCSIEELFDWEAR